MDKRNEVTLNGKRYLVLGHSVCVYCESKVAWRSGWRKVTSAKITAEVFRAHSKAAACADVLCDLKSAANYIDTLGGNSKSYRGTIAKAEVLA